MTEMYEWLLKKAVLAVESGNTADEILLSDKNTYTVGRTKENDIVCKSELVSRHHCLFFRNENNLFIQDLKSVNGIFINGLKQKSQIMVPLEDGDIIGIGINEKISTDFHKFVYKVHKQVVIDLEREHIKMELQSPNCEEEIHQPLNKLLKTESLESKQKVQNLNCAVSNSQLGDEILKHKTPSKVSKEIFGTSSSMKIGLEMSVNKGYKGPMPNIIVNEMSLFPSANALQIPLNQAVTTENQSGPSHGSLENFSENSRFQVTEMSRRNYFPLNSTTRSTINIESSSSEDEVSTSPILIEERQEVQKSKRDDLPKEIEKSEESTEPQQTPDSTNAENKKIVSNSSARSSVNDSDSDTSMMLCTSTTNTSQSKTSEVKKYQDMDLNLKSTNKKSFTVIQKDASGERREVLRFIDEVDKNSNSDVSCSEIEWLQRENEKFIQNAIPLMDPRTSNSNNKQATSQETNCSINLNVGEINPAWEKAIEAISALHNTPNVPTNPFLNSQFSYPIHPISYSNPQNLYPNHYQMVYPNEQYPYPNYQMQNCLNPHQNYQIPYMNNWTPSYSSNQVPYVVGQTQYSVTAPYPNFDTPVLNNNQSQRLCSDDLSLPNSCSIEKTREEESKIFKEFSASWQYEAIEKTHTAGGMEFKNTNKATPKIVRSEIVNISYKGQQQSQGNNNLTDSVPVEKFKPDVKKVASGIATNIPDDKFFNSYTKSDEVLMNIVSWRPAEFESCFSKEVPCVINSEKLPKKQLTYNNHEDYCKVQIPLILLNISYQIKNAYKMNSNKRTTFTKCEILKSSASIIWIENTTSYMIGFHIKLYESAQNLQKSPEIGDFLRIVITKGDTTFSTLIFGYVTKILNTKVEEKSDPESVEITVAVVTKLIDFDLNKSKIKEVSLIMSLLPSINLIMALDKVQKSPILPLILNPNPKDYELCPINPDINVLFETSSTQLLKPGNTNYKQLDAIRKIVDVVIRQEPKVALIEGSPGSGKTEVITNTIIEIFNGINGDEEKSQTMKVLVCAVSDAEIDEILCRLQKKRKYWKKQKMLKIVRVGNLHDMSTAQAKDFSVNEFARKHLEYKFKEFNAKNATTSLGEQLNQLRSKQKELEEEIKIKINRSSVLQLAIITTYLNIIRSGRSTADIYPDEYANLLEIAEHIFLLGANVIFCRLDICYARRMDLAFRDENLIPVLIIEGATQSIEIDILKPLTFGVQMLILVADACKRSMKYSSYPILEERGFNASLFERLKSNLELSPKSPIIRFHTQYRMNSKIAYFPNNFFFQGKVRNKVANEYSFPLVSYRVFNWGTSDNFQESEEMFVLALVQCIMYHTELKTVSKPLKIGIITTKNSKSCIMTAINDQLELISDAKRESVSIEVGTLENFLNKEFDAIFASCYRPKSGQRLDHVQKMYSIITLAKHCLLLYGTFKKFNDETTSMWNCLIDDARKRKKFVDIKAHPRYEINQLISKLKMHILKS